MTARLLIVLAFDCTILIVGSILYRVHLGKPILRPELPQLRFAETWCSGRSNRSFLASLVGAQRFLWVAVTQDTLYVSPHMPFNLIFLAEAFGWDHRVPGSTILDARQSAQICTRGAY